MRDTAYECNLPSQTLSLQPGEAFDGLAGDCDHSEAVTRVVGEHVVIIERN